jgi:hydroxyethylthiazole kinase
MIISPPFLPSPVAGETDDAFLARAMVGGIPGDGGYPLSFDLNWHGGMHLTAPKEEQSALPVRAISDGTLAYFRNPTPENPDPNHPLRYRDKWTDDGCVVIRHETEIGEGEKAKVIFFSIYMHLSKILITAPQKGKVIFRKDKIGEAGNIYGENGRIHFEVVADQSQIENLVGRKERDLKFQTGHGRSDCVWGDTYFFIPPEVLVYERAPQNILSAQNESPVAYRCPAMPSAPAPIQEVGATPSNTTDSVQGYDWSLASELQNGMFVRMSFTKGQCKLTTYTHSGFEVGSQAESGSYEYDLYNIAIEKFPKSPSAGFELLRFGRVLSGDQLIPADAAHWRKIKIPGKIGEESKAGWIDLNSFSVTKFSDADFPHWQGWQLVDDDADSDSHCQSRFIRALLNLDAGKVVSDNIDAVSIAKSPAYSTLSADEQQSLSIRYVTERQLTQSLLEKSEVQNRVKRLVCKFPSEWCKNDFDTRYDWLKRVAEGGPLPEDQYTKLKSHQQALGFWEDAALVGIDHMHWHFPPKEFIRTFSQCGWLSKNDIKGVYPAASDANINKYIVHINKTLAKYLIVGRLRRSHFFGQAGVESNQLVSMSELYNGTPHDYFRRYANASNYNGWLGNIKYNDGGDFRGRGLKQLTGRANYANYWVYRGWLQASSFSDNWWKHTSWWGITISGPTVTGAQKATLPIQNAATIAQLDAQIRPPVIINPDRVKDEHFTCIDTAGWFWAKNKLLGVADSNDIAKMTRRIRGDGDSVGTADNPWPDAANFPARETMTNKLLKFF